jgi:hypothetical protein
MKITDTTASASTLSKQEAPGGVLPLKGFNCRLNRHNNRTQVPKARPEATMKKTVGFQTRDDNNAQKIEVKKSGRDEERKKKKDLNLDLPGGYDCPISIHSSWSSFNPFNHGSDIFKKGSGRKGRLPGTAN